MTNDYQQNWDFYFTEIEDKPASIFVDLGLHRVFPVKENPFVLTLLIEMDRPQDNGFSSKEESEILFKIEDKVTPVLNKSFGAIFAGRMTYNGSRMLYYYLKNIDNAKKQVNGIMETFPDYAFSVTIESDADWEKYINYLYPQDYELHTIMNRRIIEGMQEKGDDGSEPRNVDHYIYFKYENDRSKFASEAVKMGYEISSKRDLGNKYEYRLSLIISRKEPVTFEEINDHTSLLYDLADDNNGQYDGWETQILTN